MLAIFEHIPGIQRPIPQNPLIEISASNSSEQASSPDTLHKPALTKPIKNFEPDTGIPSIKTIVEYKFLSDRSQVGPVADQILADTRGYTSDKWKAFLYVIYETERFKREAEWRQLLRACGNAESVSAIVLSGASVNSECPKRPKTAVRRISKAAQASR
jgi:hypothetical protein